MRKNDAVRFLLEHPAKLGNLLGFDRLGDLHNAWIADMVTGTGDKTLQAHRGSYKTTCVSVALAIIMVLLPNKRILFLRKTDTDTKEVLAQVRKILESAPMRVFARAIYGVELSLTKATANELTTNLTTDIKGTAQLVGLGLGSSITGKHFDRIFTDDIVNISDRLSRVEREYTKTIYRELRNVINRDGRIYNTGTPWHEEDAFSIMPPAEKFDCYTTGLISQSELAAIRDGMTATLFAVNYELRHISSDDVIFPSPDVGAETALAECGEAHIDAGYYGEDYTALTVCRKAGGEYYVYGRCWRRHVDECLPDIDTAMRLLRAHTILCETNADKGYLAKTLRQRGYRVLTYHESLNKHIKIVTHLKANWKRVHFVGGTDAEYIAQIGDYTEDAEHDDCPDSLASLLRRLETKGGRGVKAPRRTVGLMPESEVIGGWNGY